eukprot:1260719-Rhodomonas_salina.1
MPVDANLNLNAHGPGRAQGPSHVTPKQLNFRPVPTPQPEAPEASLSSGPLKLGPGKKQGAVQAENGLKSEEVLSA